jgi:hypothetical protein
MSAIGFLREPGPLTIDGARVGLCSFLLAHQNEQLPVLLADANPALDSLHWLGISWREPPTPPHAVDLLDALARRGLLYPCGCDALPSHICPQQAPLQKKYYRLRLSELELLRYQDKELNEVALRAEDPFVADAERRPSPALELALGALAADVSTMITLRTNEAVSVLLAVLRIFQAKTPLQMIQLPPLESYEALPLIPELRAQGYLPHAVTNALSLLFWSPPSGVTAISKELLLLLYKSALI